MLSVFTFPLSGGMILSLGQVERFKELTKTTLRIDLFLLENNRLKISKNARIQWEKHSLYHSKLGSRESVRCDFCDSLLSLHDSIGPVKRLGSWSRWRALCSSLEERGQTWWECVLGRFSFYLPLSKQTETAVVLQHRLPSFSIL